jgi:hypothetical protein
VFWTTGGNPLTEQCDLVDFDHFSCGDSPISKDECEKLQCCFSSITSPHCYYAPTLSYITTTFHMPMSGCYEMVTTYGYHLGFYCTSGATNDISIMVTDHPKYLIYFSVEPPSSSLANLRYLCLFLLVLEIFLFL